MKTLTKALLIFFTLLLISSLMITVFKTEFGTRDFFANRGWFFLLFITLFPRLTLLFSSVASGGVLWWLSFIFYPRVLVASLATVAYFKTNPVLVVISWMVALSGEVFEKWGATKPRFIYRSYGVKHPTHQHEPLNENVVEAEFEVKK